jgi:hypothetical protein
MSKPIKTVLPDKTVALFERLREQLKAGYRANAERDLAIAAEWFPLEEEAYRTLEAFRKSNRITTTKRAAQEEPRDA